MEINKTRTIIIFILINILVIGVSFGLYYVFMDAFEKTYTKNHIYAFQSTISSRVESELQELNYIFDDVTKDNNLNELNNLLLDEAEVVTEKGYVGFIKNNSNYFTYNLKDYNINNFQVDNYGFGFFRDQGVSYLFIFNDAVVGIVDFNTVFLDIINITNANDVILMSNEGSIFYNYDVVLYKEVLDSYLIEETNYYFETYFSRKREALIQTTFNNKQSTILFTPLKEHDSLYIGQQFYKDSIETEFVSLRLFIMAIFIIVSALDFLILIIIFFWVNKRNSDIENAKIKYYYDKPYIIKIDKKGKVLSANKKFIADFPDFNKKLISQYFLGEESLMEKIKRGSMIIYNNEDQSIGFLPLKVNRGFYLVGDYLKGDVSFGTEAHNLAYYNQITGLGNKHLYEKQIQQLLSDVEPLQVKTVYFVGLEIKEYESLSSYLNKGMVTAVFKKMAEDLLTLVKGKNITVYHTDDPIMTLVFDTKSLKEVESVTNNIVKHFEKPIQISESKIDFRVVGAIVPVEIAQNKPLTASIVYDQIIETLKRAKQSTTQQYLIFDETITHFLTERQQIEKDLVEAIKKREFIPFLQPQYNFKEDRIEGFEALIRWDNPNYFNKSPLMFIDIAEESEMINDIGKIMMEKTFKAAEELQDFNITISLNVTPNQMLSQGFTEELLRLYKKHNLKPNSIALEITENTLLKSFNVANDKIRILKKNGIRVDLDDFGTGYSSLPYIKELNFDTIKIDKTFVDYIETDKYNKAIVQMIISLAKTLNATVIAEGVETERQMNYLVKAGCNLIQGYYISKPLPIEEAKALLEDYNIKKTKSFKTKGGK